MVEKDKLELFQEKLHRIIFEADTPLGKLFDVVLLVLIVISILVVTMETVNEIDQIYHQEIVAIEWVLTIFFTLEYIARLIAVKKPLSYAKSFYGIIDLLAVLPSYLGFFIAGGQNFVVLRALRLLRIFRILKLVRFSNASEVINRALIASRYKIMVFMIFILTLITIIGAMMYLIEGQTNEGFESIPKSIYWAIVTLTTVGFGDITPSTGLGRFLASVIMILGYGIIAVPTGIVTSEFVRDKQGKITTKSCPHCGAEGHKERAKYCYSCGENLSRDN